MAIAAEPISLENIGFVNVPIEFIKNRPIREDMTTFQWNRPPSGVDAAWSGVAKRLSDTMHKH
jgi:hypothetical protein